MTHSEMSALWKQMYPESSYFGNTDRFIVGAFQWLIKKRRISITWDEGWVIEGHPRATCGYVTGDEFLVDALCSAINVELQNSYPDSEKVFADLQSEFPEKTHD